MEAKGGLGVIDQDHADIKEMFGQVRDPDSNRGNALRSLVKRISTHVAVERAELYPVVIHKGVGGRDTADALERDYKAIEHLLVVIERRKINSPDMPDLVSELWRSFDDHERQLSELRPALESALTPEEKSDLNRKMEAAQEVILSHPHPHMLSLGLISRLTTRIAARFDRLRDKTVNNRMMTDDSSDRSGSDG
jgi:hypothetical protein